MRSKLGRFMKGHHASRVTEFKKGRKLPPETIEKMRGRIPWNKGLASPFLGKKNPFFGKTHTAESNEKNRQWHLGRKPNSNQLRSLSLGRLARFKGNSAGYDAFHKRVSAIKGRPAHCEFCKKTGGGSRGYHWANLTRRYFDVEDYKRLCSRCHWHFDARRRRQTGKKTTGLGG